MNCSKQTDICRLMEQEESSGSVYGDRQCEQWAQVMGTDNVMS